jgi:RNA polymerase-binding protein DksA
MEPATSPYAVPGLEDPEVLGLARVRLERERQRHLAQRAILIDQIARGRERTADIDRRSVAHTEEVTLLTRLLQRHQTEIAAITAALDRLRRRTYGTCERCGKPIGSDRLEAMPAAAQCLTCQVSRRPLSGAALRSLGAHPAAARRS